MKDKDKVKDAKKDILSLKVLLKYHKAKVKVLRRLSKSELSIEAKSLEQNEALSSLMLEVNEKKVDVPQPEEYGYYYYVLWQEFVKAYKTRVAKNKSEFPMGPFYDSLYP